MQAEETVNLAQQQDNQEEQAKDVAPAPSRGRTVVAIIFSVLLAASLAGFIAVISRTGWLTPGLLIAAIAVDVLLSGGLVTLLFRSRSSARRVRFVVGVVLSVLLMAVNSLVGWLGSGYNNLLGGIQAPAADTIQYDIVALASAPPFLDSYTNTMMGQAPNDTNQMVVQSHVNDFVSGIEFVDTADWSTAVDSLLSGQYPSIVIQDGYLQIFADAAPDDYAKVQILATFDIPGTAILPGNTYNPSTPVAADAPFIVYISGIDTAGPIATRSRSDVNQLMVVNPKTGKVLLVSTPRDYYVTLADMPQCSLPDKLTHAGVYGINVSVDTIDALYGINIDYYVRLNFTSLMTLVDAIGGIDVESSVAFTAGNYTFIQGMNHMNGAQALAFSRARHPFETGDRQRGMDQQAVITAILKKLTQPSSLINYSAIVSAVSGSVQTSMTPEQISSLVKRQISAGTNWNIQTMSVTGADSSDYTCSYPHQQLYVMLPDQTTVDSAKQAIQKVLNGQ
ncbi:MAG: LCP family protein [Propionibacteriaceae bacterium]|nr:LCP family protein [Propionibacteriaceae bacterium]